MNVKTAPRHRKVVADTTGGAEGNEHLTAMTGAALLVLLAAEGLTIVAKRQLLTLHFFLGMLLIGPVLLKLASTGYRFVKYYTGSQAYVRKGPPVLLLRLLGPVIILTSVGVIGSGVVLALIGPRPSQWLSLALLAHKGFFVLWFGAMTIHVVWYAPKLPRLLAAKVHNTSTTRGGGTGGGRLHAVLAGAGRRWLALTAALALGLVIALATYHLAAPWTHLFGRGIGG
jgi:hypothetical protein